MLFKCALFCVTKSLIGNVRNLVFGELHKQHEPVLQERLGFSTIDEYMRATPEEIRLRQNRF